MRKSELKQIIREVIEESRIIEEGQFSWFTQDGYRQIGCEQENRIPVIMTDNNGNEYKETSYDGYGVFGGKDYFELLAEMNGLESNRDLGISLYFDDKPDTIYPSLTSRSIDHTSWNFELKPDDDPNQGWPVDDEDDEDYDEDYNGNYNYYDEEDDYYEEETFSDAEQVYNDTYTELARFEEGALTIVLDSLQNGKYYSYWLTDDVNNNDSGISVSGSKQEVIDELEALAGEEISEELCKKCIIVLNKHKI